VKNADVWIALLIPVGGRFLAFFEYRSWDFWLVWFGNAATKRRRGEGLKM
jgi:hypothetical protein